jgi:hypothetical protein
MPASMEWTRHSGSDPLCLWQKPGYSRFIAALTAFLLLLYATTSSATATPGDARAVARLYSAAFDREPESGGLNFWIDSLEKGQSLLQIAEKFRNSPEFKSRYGALGNTEFVAQLYRNILGREGEDAGLAFWLDKLESGTSQALVLRQFSESPENRRKTDDLFAEMHQSDDGRWTYDMVSGPVNSTGTIDGFGSIFVNGVEFETEGANITLDGNSSTDDNLRLGMVVTVNGVINDDGLTGTASRVQFDDEVQGPITALVPGQDGDTLLLTVLGIEVIVERTSTVFEDVRFETLAVNDLVEVSGFFDDQGRLRATFIERKSAFTAGVSEVELKGIVSAVAGTQFTIGKYLVDFSGADLSGVPGGVIVNGMGVEVHGTLASSTITANRIEQDDVSGGFDDRDEIRVEGAITNYASISQFELNGVLVDGSGAILWPADLVLANGQVVQVEGQWSGNTLVARKIESRRGRVEIEAGVASVDRNGGTVTLRLFGGTLTVVVDARTLLDDDTDQASPLTLADLSPGDFLEVEALQVGDRLVATRIDRDRQDDDVLQAPVSAFTGGVDITLLGITYSTAGARFEGFNGASLGSAAFFTQLKVGDLVKVKDERVADGIADEVEFEHLHALDGDDDSRDGCEPGDDCGGDDSGQVCEPGDDCGGDDSGQGCEPGDDCGGGNSGKG